MSRLINRTRVSHRAAMLLAVFALALTLSVPLSVVLASHRFSDVPTSHQFHNAIAAVADAGITTGCGGTRYCPNGLVTRGQMAAFLSRLGALAPGSAPKVNADRVDGVHASGFLRTDRLTSATVLQSSPDDTFILRDSRTGADVLLANQDGLVKIVNSGSSRMQVAGMATGIGTSEPVYSELLAGQVVSISANGIGPKYLDLTIVVPGTTAAATRISHLTCSAADGTGGQQDVLSCIVTG